MTAKLSLEINDALTSVIAEMVAKAVDEAIAAKITNSKSPLPITNDNRQARGFKLPKAD